MEDFQNFNREYSKFQQQHPKVRVTAVLKAFHVCQGLKAESIQEASEHVYTKDECSGWCKDWLNRNKYR